MLPAVFEEFEAIHLFFATFFFSLLWSVRKRSILAKIWGRVSSPSPQPPRFLQDGLVFVLGPFSRSLKA